MAGLKIGGVNIGSGGAAASKGCGGGCGAIFGVLLGIALIPVGFYIAYHAEARLVNHGKVFEAVMMSEPDAARAQEAELVKIQGQAEGDFLTIEEWDGEALHYRKVTDEYEEKRDSEGEVERSWENVSSISDWVASFDVGGIEIRPEAANPVGKDEVYSAYKKRYETAFHVGTQPSGSEVGDQRKRVEVLDASKPVIVMGQMSNGSIQGGTTFVVSTQNEQQTIQALKSAYAMSKWLMRGGAILAIFSGVMAIFGPLTSLVGHVPLVGQKISGVFTAIAFVFAVVAVTIVTVFIKAFWVLVAIVVLVIGYMIYRGIKTPRQKPGGGGAGGGSESAPPAPPTSVAWEEAQAEASPTLPPRATPVIPVPSASEETPPVENAVVTPPPATSAEHAAASDFMRPAEPSAGAQTPPVAAQSPTPAPLVEPEPDTDEASMHCSACGAGLKMDDKFCQACGSQTLPPAPNPAASAFMRPAEPSEEQAQNLCPKCGEAFEAGSKFCQKCGEKIG